MKFYLFYFFSILAAFFLAWAFKIGNNYILSHSNIYEKGRYRYTVYGKHFFIPFYVYSRTKDEKLKKECKIYLVLFVMYSFISLSYAIYEGWDFRDVQFVGKNNLIQ